MATCVSLAHVGMRGLWCQMPGVAPFLLVETMACTIMKVPCFAITPRTQISSAVSPEIAMKTGGMILSMKMRGAIKNKSDSHL
jgi:hypothetical protein